MCRTGGDAAAASADISRPLGGPPGLSVGGASAAAAPVPLAAAAAGGSAQGAEADDDPISECTAESSHMGQGELHTADDPISDASDEMQT